MDQYAWSIKSELNQQTIQYVQYKSMTRIDIFLVHTLDCARLLVLIVKNDHESCLSFHDNISMLIPRSRFHEALRFTKAGLSEQVNIKAHPKLNPNLNPKRLGFRVRV